MKRMMPVVLLCAVLMTGCDDYYDETKTAESAEEKMSEDRDISGECTETCSDWIIPETTESKELPEFSETQEIATISEKTELNEYEYEEENEPEIIEISEETAPDPTETAQPETTSCMTESVAQAETVTETEIIPETVESTEIPGTKSETVSEQEVTDFEKAQMFYEYMLESGCGTCVNYACQTYKKCLEIELPCYIVWTDAGIYGHVANTVCVNEIWFILDTQAECFLEFNYGFTEVVDEDGEHIADSDMLSNYSYQELFR